MARKELHRHTESTSSTASASSATTTRSTSTNSSASTAPAIRRRREEECTKEQPKASARFAEVAGGTAAECAAICCCCPCGLAGLLFCALVKLPAGLCRRAIVRKRKRRTARKRSALLAAEGRVEEKFGVAREEGERWVVLAKADPSPELEEMERVMWARFYSTGFWRSPSQREDR